MMEETETVRPLNDISEELKILLSIEEQIDLVYRLNETLPIEYRMIQLNSYQASNLISVIKATGYDFKSIGMNSSMDDDKEILKNNPLSVLNSGDWLIEIYNKVKELDRSHNPNKTALQYIEEAKEILKRAS
jgi:hypothetical protein